MNLKKTYADPQLILIIPLLITTILLLGGCGSGSSAEGIVTDYFEDTPISDAQISAMTNTNIAEEKSKAHVTSKTGSGGKFLLDNMLPERHYELNITAPGYFPSKAQINSPPEKQTRLIEKPIKLIRNPPKAGFYIFSSGQYTSLTPFTKIHRERRILYTGFAVDSPSIRYLLESDLTEISKVKNGSYLIIYGKEHAFWSKEANMYRGGYIFPWYIHSLVKYPQRTYEQIVFKGAVGSPTPVTIPESFYCGLKYVNPKREWGGHKYDNSMFNLQDIAGMNDKNFILHKLNLPPGKYIISNFHNNAYVSSTDYSEEKVIGYLFEII